jgi:transcriptional regulator with XRE-family HTH domain
MALGSFLRQRRKALGITLQELAKRVEAGTASSAQAGSAGAGARGLAELAWAFAQRAH